jgi:hypothetical protein
MADRRSEIQRQLESHDEALKQLRKKKRSGNVLELTFRTTLSIVLILFCVNYSLTSSGASAASGTGSYVLTGDELTRAVVSGVEIALAKDGERRSKELRSVRKHSKDVRESVSKEMRERGLLVQLRRDISWLFHLDAEFYRIPEIRVRTLAQKVGGGGTLHLPAGSFSWCHCW